MDSFVRLDRPRNARNTEEILMKIFRESSNRCVDWILIALILCVATGRTWAQESAVQLQVTPDDRLAATIYTSNIRYHLHLAKTAAAGTVAQDFPNPNFKQSGKARLTSITAVPTPPQPAFYPQDMFKVASTGATILSAKSHPVFVDCASGGGTCWGNPSTFLTNLGNSNFVHLLDQYTGSTANGRYTLGAAVTVTQSIFAGTSGVPTLSENDILTIVHAAAKTNGAGLGHIYHVFLPNGVDTCMDEGPCYSPDNFGTFAFCAYHFRVHFSDIGNVYYTVEPFQNVLGCQVPASPAPPNGQLADSTNNILSHELFETVTDPDIFTGFRATNTTFGEIGDVCQGVVAVFGLNAHNYEIQLEYSDTYHACASTP
jgi:hypothetical protein